ncbi:hypothetical protein [Serratia marcescens]|uniref:hypothetical protein n=1 Tax=Serratia marcescens TaxID=615 RepID=UPI00217C10E1|nr:hypothetical protein [Serratia marcescens]CAI1785137.1 Uncharacterised protein [Serratia proteamaculans]
MGAALSESPIDKNVYANLVVILRQKQQSVLAEQYQREAAGLFPMDARFIVAMNGNLGGNKETH